MIPGDCMVTPGGMRVWVLKPSGMALYWNRGGLSTLHVRVEDRNQPVRNTQRLDEATRWLKGDQ